MTIPICEVTNTIKELADTIACGRLTVLDVDSGRKSC